MRPLRMIVFVLIHTALLLGTFALGFLGEPENDPWLNASPLWGPGDPFHFPGETGSNFLAHPILIWRGRPGFESEYVYAEGGVVNEIRNNAFGFRDDELTDPKPDGLVRVLNVGDSATWGLNLFRRLDTYSDQLEEMLARRGGGGSTRFEVVNAGVVGYSSLQGLQLLRLWLDDLSPDIVTIYLGNNDTTPGSIRDSERVLTATGPLRSLLQRNRFYLMLQKGVLHLRARHVEAERKALGDSREQRKSELRRDVAAFYRLRSRVPPEMYEQNLRDMVNVIREAGARPLLLDVPMNLVWPPRVRPFVALKPGGFWSAVKIEMQYLARVHAGTPACERSLDGHPYLCRVIAEDFAASRLPSAEEQARIAADSSLDEYERLRASHNLAVRELALGDPAEAARQLEIVLEAADRCDCFGRRNYSWLHYNLGIARLLDGQEDTAFDALLASRRIWPFAITPEYGERFQRVAEELEVEWVDLPQLFREADPRFHGSALTHDWVHPNPQGNRIIAKAIADRMGDVLAR